MSRVIKCSIGSVQEGYLVELCEDGAYLTIYPKSEGRTDVCSWQDIRNILYNHKIMDYDVIKLMRLVSTASGIPEKLSDEMVNLNEDGIGLSELIDVSDAEDASNDTDKAKIIVEISRDKMEAIVRIDTSESDKMPTVEEVVDALSEKQVVFGIDMYAIAVGLDGIVPFVAAKGLKPLNGEDARIERKIDFSLKGQPEVKSKNKVDYKNMNIFVKVKKDDVLAVRIPQTKGKNGTNVLGQLVGARNGRPKPLPIGRNTAAKGEEGNDANILIALIDGQVIDNGSKIHVDKHLIVNSSVGVGTGNINFGGSVQILGDVEYGFEVVADGDIEIRGNVSGATIKGHNVYISGGINGQRQGVIVAKGNLHAAFIENGTVEASGDVNIADSMLHSIVKATGKVSIIGGRGQIIGGRVFAGIEIRATKIGNTVGAVTYLSVGTDPILVAKRNELVAACNEQKTSLQKIEYTLKNVSKLDISSLSEERIQKINMMARQQFLIMGEIKNLEKKIQELQERLDIARDGRILVSDTLYTGTRIKMYSVSKIIEDDKRYCALAFKDDAIIFDSYSVYK